MCDRAFRPHTHIGCDLRRNSSSIVSCMFQSTHPHGVRPPERYNFDYIFNSFNPRTHTGCDLQLRATIYSPVCFNPRTHTGCDAAHLAGAGYLTVSIHAPTRDATEIQTRPYRICNVSIHAPTQGATQWQRIGTAVATFQSTHPHRVRLRSLGIRGRNRWFQSTHPHRVRRHRAKPPYKKQEVSIHAPTQGATYGCSPP